MNKTKIEWVKNDDGTQGYTINPVKGMCPVGCSYCYARAMYKRFKWDPEIRMEPDWAEDLSKKPSRVFVGSTMELFGEWISPEWLDFIFTSCHDHPEHTFFFLTKKPENLLRVLPFSVPDNCWIGVSVTHDKMLTTAMDALVHLEATTFISFEPLLERIDAEAIAASKYYRWLDWIIIGQQTPVRTSTMPKIEWVKEIVQATDQAGIPVFLKENLKPLIQEAGMRKAEWAAKEWVKCEYPILRQEFPFINTH